MAYTDGYDYDIFISYSHDDDTAPEGRTGWVTGFRDYLSDWLVKKRHLKGLKIWFDDELSGNTVFDRAIEDRISRSALFFVLHSHNYRDFNYCRKELDWFFSHNKSRPGGLVVGEASRLFNILINNIPYSDWPQALSEAGGPTSGFVLHDAENEGAFGYPASPDHKRFDGYLRKLVEATAKTLDAFPRKAQPEAEAQPQASGVSVFLADAPDSLRSLRKRLSAEIGDKAQILDALPPPYPLAEHDQKLAVTLQQASLSIHLMDQWPGREVDDLDEQTYPLLQAETAVRHPASSLIWMPDGLAYERIEDAAHAAWLKKMEQGEREDADFQLIRSGQQALIDLVLQTIGDLQQRASGGGPGETGPDRPAPLRTGPRPAPGPERPCGRGL